MANTIQLKRRVSGNAGSPAALKSGEVAHNEVDNTLYVGKGDDGSGNATSIVPLAGKGAFADLTSTQTLGGVKTFSTAPKSSQDASGSTDLVRKSQFDAGLLSKADASHSHAASAITSGTFADARVAQTNVTQHQAALSITESQISDLGLYLTGISGEALGDLGDVTLTSVGTGELLKWSGTAWINQTLGEAGIAAASHSHAIANVTGLQPALDAKAPLASPALTGTPTAPTATAGTNTAQVATTAFVHSAVSSSAVEALGDVGDVTLSTPGNNELLAFDSTSGDWINQTLSEAGVAAASHGHSASDITSGTLPVTRGGTGATTTSSARAALGLAIGSDVQAYSAVLAATTASFTTADETKLDNISVTQAVDLDAIKTRVSALDAAIVLKGTWDASLGSFPGSGSAQSGESWIVSTGGTVNGVAFAANDRLIAIADNASTTIYAANWHKADYSDEVQSVAGKTGAVTLAASDIASGAFANGRISQSSVAQHQAALSISNSQVTGLGTMATQAADNVAITGGSISGVIFDGGTF